MSTVHFIYAVPPTNDRPSPLRRFKRAAGHAAMRGGTVERMLVGRPLPAPYSITANVYRYLSARTPTELHDWRTRTEPRVGPSDVIVGHPHPDESSILQRIIRNDIPCAAVILLLPLHHAVEDHNSYLLPLLDRVDAVLGIMGKVWHETIRRSFLGPWASKVERLDMAVSTRDYPFLKHSFNPEGERGFLYIGANRSEKGTDLLAETFSRTDARRAWIGAGPTIPGVPRLAEHMRFTPRKVRALMSEFDCLVNLSRSDANPTTIIEAMAWGLPVACTPSSGYSDRELFTALSTSDIDANVAAIEGFQSAALADLRHRQAAGRRRVLQDHSWDTFCRRVWDVVDPFVPR